MADTQQGLRQQSARDAAGTLETYDGDLRALFESVATVPPGSTFNEAFILWLQDVTGSSADNINDLAALFASQQDDTYNWSSGGPLSPASLFSWSPKTVQTLPVGATFSRIGTKQQATTIDGVTFFDQTLLADEIPFANSRRVQNFNPDPDVISGWNLITGAVVNGDRVDLPDSFSGVTHNTLTIPSEPVTGKKYWGFLRQRAMALLM